MDPQSDGLFAFWCQRDDDSIYEGPAASDQTFGRLPPREAAEIVFRIGDNRPESGWGIRSQFR